MKTTEYQLANGKLKYIEEEFGHSYFHSELGYAVSVTTVLSGGLPLDEWLLDWFKRSDFETMERKRDQALKHGSNFHNLAYKLNSAEKLGMVDETNRTRAEVASYIQFVREWRPTDIEPEKVVFYSDSEMQYAGTVDMVCTIGDKRVLIDFKTSKKIGISAYLQVLAYANAWEQSYEEKIDEVMILQVGTATRTINKRTPILGKPSNGMGWKMHQVDRKMYSFNDFVKVYDMYKFVNGGEIPNPPTVIVYPDEVQLFKKGGKITIEDFVKE